MGFDSARLEPGQQDQRFTPLSILKKRESGDHASQLARRLSSQRSSAGETHSTQQMESAAPNTLPSPQCKSPANELSP